MGFYYLLETARDALKTALERVIQKPSKATGNLIRNKIAVITTKVPKTSTQNN